MGESLRLLQLSLLPMEGAVGAFGANLVATADAAPAAPSCCCRTAQPDFPIPARRKPYYLTFAVLRQIPAVEQHVDSFLRDQGFGCFVVHVP